MTIAKLSMNELYTFIYSLCYIYHHHFLFVCVVCNVLTWLTWLIYVTNVHVHVAASGRCCQCQDIGDGPY